MKHILILMLAILCTTSLAGTRNPEKSDEQYISYGSEFNCVLRIKCTTNKGLVYYASATALDDNWILTAAHVVKHAVSVQVIQDGVLIDADKIIPHKDFLEANYGYHDIALCHVEKPFKLTFYPQLYNNKDEIGKICSISGYGAYGTFETGIVGSDGKQRAGSNKIEHIDRQLLVCTASRPSSKDNTDLEFVIANGDSGGGLFIGNKIAGVNSCVMAVDKKTDSNYGDESGHTRVSSFVDWILENKK